MLEVRDGWKKDEEPTRARFDAQGGARRVVVTRARLGQAALVARAHAGVEIGEASTLFERRALDLSLERAGFVIDQAVERQAVAHGSAARRKMEPAATETPGAADPAGAGVIPGKRQDVTGRRAVRARQTLGEGAPARGIAEILRRGEVGGGGAGAPELVKRILVRRDHPCRIDPQPARERLPPAVVPARRSASASCRRIGALRVPKAESLGISPHGLAVRAEEAAEPPARERLSSVPLPLSELRHATRAPAASTARSRATRRASASTDRWLACSTRARSRPGPRRATGSPRRAGFSPWSARSLSRERPSASISAHWVSVCGQLTRDGVKRRTRKLSLRVSGDASPSPTRSPTIGSTRTGSGAHASGIWLSVTKIPIEGSSPIQPGTRDVRLAPGVQGHRVREAWRRAVVRLVGKQDAIAAGEARREPQVPERHGQEPGEIPARPFAPFQKRSPDPPRPELPRS